MSRTSRPFKLSRKIARFAPKFPPCSIMNNTMTSNDARKCLSIHAQYQFNMRGVAFMVFRVRAGSGQANLRIFQGLFKE